MEAPLVAGSAIDSMSSPAVAMAAACGPAPTTAVAAEAPEGCTSGSDGSSLGSASSADLLADHQAAVAAADLDPAQRTHHLLKHCLSSSQRGAALAQFNTTDPREAAKEIARMGQRELQAKFKEVYGSATKSNNNSWLRRKLYEAVGVAPLKANTKGKARKSASSSASRKSSHHSKDAKARSPKVTCLKVKRPSEPSSPRAIVLSHDSHTSDSEDGTASHGSYHDGHGLPYTSYSAPGSPHSHFPGSVFGRAAPQQQQLGMVVGMDQMPADFVPISPRMGAHPYVAAEPQSPPCNVTSGHWAYSPLQQQQPAGTAAAAPAPAPFFPASSQGLSLNSGLSDFSGMELEQEAHMWETEAQPWYFGGASMDLSGLGGLRPADALPMDIGGSSPAAAVAAGCLDEDEVPLLTFNLDSTLNLNLGGGINLL